jgi:peptidoglycan/xylan/chitin deacetylase (PgdA/CDA1 family)
MRRLLILLGLVLASLATAAQADEGKRIALTFDDVPRHAGAFLTPDERTTRLIDGLATAGVKQAAFFVTVGNLDQTTGGEARIARYVAAGHVLANHTWSHPHLSEVTAEAFLADIDKASAWLSQRESYRPWMRFPYLDEGREDKAKREAVRAGLAARGMRNGIVTIDASDWKYDDVAIQAKAAGRPMDREALRDLWVESHVQAAEYYDGLARRALGRSPAHVLLMHETDLSALFVADLVAALKAKGWTIVTADEAFADPVAIMLPDVPSAQGTITEMIAWERGLPAPRWYARNDEALATREFDMRVLGVKPHSQEEAK